MNLQEAGAQALERCKELVTHAEDASKRVDDIDAEVEKINQQLHGDWQHAMERAQQLLARLKAERAELESEADAGQALLRDLHGKLAEAEQQMVSAVHDLLSEVNTFEQLVEQQEPLLQESLNQVHEKGRSLKEHADEVHGQLETTAQETEGHLSDDVASALAEISQAHASRVDQLEEHVQGTSIPEIDQHHEHLHAAIDDHKSAYEEAVHTAHEKTHQSATDTLAEASNKHNEVFQQFEQIGNEAKKLMNTLKTGIDTGAETIGAVEEAVKAGVNTTSVGLRAAIGTLEELMKFFQHFSFIKL